MPPPPPPCDRSIIRNQGGSSSSSGGGYCHSGDLNNSGRDGKSGSSTSSHSGQHQTSSSTTMGNGASGGLNHLIIEGEKYDAGKIKAIIPKLKRQVYEKQAQNEQLQAQVQDLSHQLKMREVEVKRLTAEVDKLKSVLQLKVTDNMAFKGSKNDALDVIQESAIDELRSHRQGVSGESPSSAQATVVLRHFSKSMSGKQQIMEALKANDFLQNLGPTQVLEIADSMYEKSVSKGHFIIKEGEPGQHLYVSASGEFEVIKDKQVLGKMQPGRAFGELAILYNCTRTASVRALTDVKVWVLDRAMFQAIMMKTGLERREESIKFLKSVDLLKTLPEATLAKISDVLELDIFRGGQYIIREGATGDTFFLINEGEVMVTQTVSGKDKMIRKLVRGDYFGEKALLSEDRRTANCVAMDPGVECLTIDRDSFNQLIGDLNELRTKDYGDKDRSIPRLSAEGTQQEVIALRKEYESLRLRDLEPLATLGIGGFGRVELVQLKSDRSKTFALKCLKKQHVVETRQQEHVYSEKKIMMDADTPFIAKLYRTFRDNKYVYMLIEPCLGGELWTILRDRVNFDDQTARYCVACVIEAFKYLHGRCIIYRDLKPENLLLDSKGLVKLVDFGFAKKLLKGKKTWTFCGTPEYVAPEIILNRGHDYAADYWSLGILIFELLTGNPPFTSNDPMKTYNIILQGKMNFPRIVSNKAEQLVRKLCQHNPGERLGYGKNGLTDICRHKWFQGFDWEGLAQGLIKPPIIPKVKGPTDYSNFDRYEPNIDIPPDETSGWDINF